MSIEIGENESAKYWPGVLNSLKNRGLRGILILCADGLTGLKDAVATAFPQIEFQRCIVHQVRNTLNYVATKDRKNFAADLKKIYTAKDEPTAARLGDEVDLNARDEILADKLGSYCSYLQVLADSSHDCLHHKRD